MNILVIGNINSVHIQNFNKSLVEIGLQKSISIKLDGLHIHNTVDIGCDVHYEQLFIPNAPLRPLIARIPKFRALINFINRRIIYCRINRQASKYDCIILQGFWKKSLDIFKAIGPLNAYTVGAFWGSDFYRRDKRYDGRLQRVLQQCDQVIISTKRMEADIRQQLNVEDEKVANVLFGVQALQRLFDYKDVSKAEAKKRLLFNESDFVITCGYCARPEMRHKEMIAAIEKIKGNLPEKYHLIFPMTYSGTDSYIEEVRKLLQESHLRHTVIDSFIGEEDIVFLRKATDIFIQIQTTDANSGSMQEHLVAQNVVITGSWLPYQEYIDKGIYFETIDAPDQLSLKMSEVLQNWESLCEKVRQNNLPEKFRLSLWSEAIKDWYEVITDKKLLKHG